VFDGVYSKVKSIKDKEAFVVYNQIYLDFDIKSDCSRSGFEKIS
jgi:hypothetical protein